MPEARHRKDSGRCTKVVRLGGLAPRQRTDLGLQCPKPLWPRPTRPTESDHRYKQSPLAHPSSLAPRRPDRDCSPHLEQCRLPTTSFLTPGPANRYQQNQSIGDLSWPTPAPGRPATTLVLQSTQSLFFLWFECFNYGLVKGTANLIIGLANSRQRVTCSLFEQ